MIIKRIQKRTLKEKKKYRRSEGVFYPLFQAVTHLALVAMRPEKEKQQKVIKKKNLDFFC